MQFNKMQTEISDKYLQTVYVT